MTLEDEPHRWVDVQHATGEEQRNSFRKTEAAWPKWKMTRETRVLFTELKNEGLELALTQAKFILTNMKLTA